MSASPPVPDSDRVPAGTENGVDEANFFTDLAVQELEGWVLLSALRVGDVNQVPDYWVCCV